jgi:hypothetical protein
MFLKFSDRGRDTTYAANLSESVTDPLQKFRMASGFKTTQGQVLYPGFLHISTSEDTRAEACFESLEYWSFHYASVADSHKSIVSVVSHYLSVNFESTYIFFLMKRYDFTVTLL